MDVDRRGGRSVAGGPGSRLRTAVGAAICVVALLCAGAVARAEPGCGAALACSVADGAYHAVPPAGWDGAAPLPATVFFHGYSSSARQVVDNEALVRAFSDQGVLLIVPDGRNGTWAHVGSPSSARDELAFMDAVLADAKARWPIDEDRLLVTGFSQGGSMAWDLACYRGDDYAAFAPIAGAFWEPLPRACPSGPVDLLHVHGLADTVVPMAGRPIREAFRQGDVGQGMALWRAHDGCPAAPSGSEEVAGLRCEVWDACASGRELRLCLHGGGHDLDLRWIGMIHRWAARLPR